MREYLVSETLPGAFKTFQEALAAAKRDEKKLIDKEIVRIVIQGMLHLDEKLYITASQLPGADHPVIVEGADEQSGFSGGKKVTGFTYWKGNIWRAKVSEIEYTRHLYIDGKMVKRPATPYRSSYQWEELKGEDYSFAYLPGEEEKYIQYVGHGDKLVKTLDYSGIATTHTEIADWKNHRDMEMVFEVGWVHRVVPIEWVKLLDDGHLYIKPLQPVFRSAKTMPGVRIGCCPNYIENVFELLGKPLEWYFDRREQMLYVGFADGDSPENHEIIIPKLEYLMEIKGELDEQPCHVSFRNLKFAHTTWLHPQKFGVPEVQAAIMNYTEAPPAELMKEKPYEVDYQKIIAAVRVLAAKDISFEGCTFTALGTGALQYEYGTQDCHINGNHFYEIAGSAVSLGDFYPVRAHHPDDRREIVRGIEVTNNHIHDTGRDFKGSVAIIAGYVQDVSISHNEIHDVPYSAISLGWGWGNADVSVGPKLLTKWTEPSVCMRNRIMYNHIFRCMSVLCDGGAIYTLGCMTGTSIIGNYIHESAGYQGEGYDKVKIGGYQVEQFRDPVADEFWKMKGVPGGIYLDEGSMGIDVCENVLHDVAVPLNYHNQIDLGYTRVWFRDNILNKRPGDEDFPMDIVSCAGLEPAYRYKLR